MRRPWFSPRWCLAVRRRYARPRGEGKCAVVRVSGHADHPVERVGAGRVGARAAVDGVVLAVEAVQRVGVLLAEEQVLARAAGDGVVVRAAVQLVVAGAAVELVVPGAAVEVVLRPRGVLRYGVAGDRVAGRSRGDV